MFLFKRLRDPLQAKTARLRQLSQAARQLMRQSRLSGHCECLLTRDAHQRPGHLLIVYANQTLPAGERGLLQLYFWRQLSGLYELPLTVVVRDSNDASRTANPSPAEAAPVASENLAERLAEMRRQMVANRERRREERDSRASASARQWAAATNAGAL
jgi:hypothetical protein